MKPGDAVTVSGIFLPEPFTGFRAMKAGLVTSTFLDAQAVSLDKKSYSDLQRTEEQKSIIAVRLLGGIDSRWKTEQYPHRSPSLEERNHRKIQDFGHHERA